MTHAATLTLQGLSKSYGRVRALKPVCLNVPPGEFLVLLGPSGSGKSTLLNLIAGFDMPTTGTIALGTRDITRLPARKRNFGMVFQSYALFPHMSVADNVAYGLKVRGVGRRETAARVSGVLQSVRLETLARRRVHQLSGGQRQRVALARALVIDPSVVLMDEPLGALDRALRKELQMELRWLHRQHGRTTLFVTHDQEEALALADRIVVMRDGAIEQAGSADDLYHAPRTPFVAGFIGDSNRLRGRCQSTVQGAGQGAGRARIAIDAVGGAVTAKVVGRAAVDAPMTVFLRPEQIRVSAAGEGAAGVKATVRERVFLGDLVGLRVETAGGQDLWVRGAASALAVTAEEVALSFDEQALIAFPNHEETEDHADDT